MSSGAVPRARHIFPTAAGKTATPSPKSTIVGNLTPREKQVAALLTGGRSNKEIAYELGVGASSVETFVARMRKSLGAPTRASLAAMLAGTGLEDH